MIDNQTIPYVDLNKCSGCKERFKIGQECQALNYRGKTVMHSCLTCWDKYYTTEKFTLAK